MPASLRPLLPRLVGARCGLITDLRRVDKDPVEPELPLIYRAQLANHGFEPDARRQPMVGSGKGFDDDDALSGAIGEAVERYCAAVWQPAALRYAARGELSGAALDPRDLVLYAPWQYAELGRYAPYRDDTVIGWVAGRTWGRDEPIWLPALAVYLSYAVAGPDEFLFPVTSSGLACAADAETALAKAACELIERDAFLLTWHHRIEPQRLSLGRHPDPQLQDLLRCYARRGVEIEAYRLRHEIGVPVAMALGVQTRGDGPAVVVGLGADCDLARAVRGAVLEVAQVRPALRIRMRSPEARRRIAELVADPMAVKDLEDHDLLYADSRMLPAFDFVRRQPAVEPDWPEPAAGVALAPVAEALGAAGLALHHVDVTPPEIRALGLVTVRALVPQLQPIHFGAREIRLGGRRFFESAARLLGRARVDPADLDPAPHPLS